MCNKFRNYTFIIQKLTKTLLSHSLFNTTAQNFLIFYNYYPTQGNNYFFYWRGLYIIQINKNYLNFNKLHDKILNEYNIRDNIFLLYKPQF